MRAPLAQSDEEEESSGAEDMDLPPMKAMASRSSVSAEAFGSWNQRSQTFVPPVYSKSEDQKVRLAETLRQSFLFQGLEGSDVEIICFAMRGPIVLEAGTMIIQEGQSGDHLYVVQDGLLDCFKCINSENVLVRTCVQGDLFGELALLYNCPRAASVVSRTQSTVWELDRETFNNIVMDGVQRKRTKYNDMLRRVSVFSQMSEGEMANIIDVLKLESYVHGDEIVRQGEEGHHFFIVAVGEVVATRIAENGDAQQYVHKEGDYFGEIALLQNAPRAATVVAYSPEVKVLSMDRPTFKRLMGSYEDQLLLGVERYS